MPIADNNVSLDTQSRRVRLIFYTSNDLDRFEANPTLTAEDYAYNTALTIAKTELVKIVIDKSSILTEHQKKIFDLHLLGLSKYQIASCLFKKCRNTGYTNVFAALFGDRRLIKGKKGYLGGAFRKLRKALNKNKRVKRLLNVIKATKERNYVYILKFLQQRDKWWKDFEKEI